MTKLKIIFPSLFLLFLGIFKTQILAENFSSTNYQIQFGNLNMTGGNKTSPSFRLTDTVGQNAPGEYDGSTTILKSGFQYIYDIFKNMSFSISTLNIPLGTLVPGTPSTGSNVLTITTPYGKGYDIYALETHSLSTQAGATIPDTICDSGTCSESISGAWTLNTKYGFGFNASGAGSSGIFSGPTQYRQFANLALNESPQIIATENINATARTTTITYKANISGFQRSGNYETAIIYLAIPKY